MSTPGRCTCQQCGADCAACPLCGPTLTSTRRRAALRRLTDRTAHARRITP